jgi:hypothetical protein
MAQRPDIDAIEAGISAPSCDPNEQAITELIAYIREVEIERDEYKEAAIDWERRRRYVIDELIALKDQL